MKRVQLVKAWLLLVVIYAGGGGATLERIIAVGDGILPQFFYEKLVSRFAVVIESAPRKHGASLASPHVLAGIPRKISAKPSLSN